MLYRDVFKLKIAIEKAFYFCYYFGFRVHVLDRKIEHLSRYTLL